MRFFALITLCLLVGCSGTNTALQASQPNLLSAGWAVGKSYKEVAFAFSVFLPDKARFT